MKHKIRCKKLSFAKVELFIDLKYQSLNWQLVIDDLLCARNYGAWRESQLKMLSVPWLVWLSRVPACEPKHCQFNSQSRHMPGLQARSPAQGT